MTTIYHNTTIFTADADGNTADAFAVDDGRFIAVGSLDDVLSLIHISEPTRPY